jgi:hypothetical protein
MASWREIEKTQAVLVRQLYDYWQSKRRGRDVPDRADIDPAEIKPLLPNILIAEVSDPPFRIRYRLVGGRVTQLTGFDFTGRYLDELLPTDFENRWHDDYREARDHRVPILGAVVVPTIQGDQFRYEFGIFPLTLGGDAVRQFIAIEDYGGREPRTLQLEDKLKPWGAKR